MFFRAANAGNNAGGGGAEGSGKDAAKEAALVEQVEDILASSGVRFRSVF